MNGRNDRVRRENTLEDVLYRTNRESIRPIDDRTDPTDYRVALTSLKQPLCRENGTVDVERPTD